MFLLFTKHNPYTDDKDVQLMLQFCDGDKQAFEKLMIAYFKPVLNFIYRYVKDAAWAEDLTQEVFIRVYKSAAGYEAKSKFKTWLFTIARNMALNALTRNKHTTISLDQTINGRENKMQQQVADRNTLNPKEELLKKEQQQQVQAAIDALPENQRTAVLLRRFENMSYDDIASAMKTTSKAVKSLLSRAKDNLRNKLG
ncbi:MAG: RNA polymerase sigma-70 factor (ECF subfamily) [Candidatus Omnitrophota bacterium]|jgi:RNA polymerase sigma-70 factor (ECF subfamily)